MEGLEPRLMLTIDLLVADVVSDSILRFAGDTGAPLGAFVTSGSGGLVDPLDPEFGPDGNLYVISNDPGHVKVLRYNGSSGAPLGTFVDLGIGSASAIEFGPDGNLYLATISETGVLRFNGATGQSMGVAASGNGIRRASGISFGPDGKLYVLDSDNVIDASADRVLRFDPSNGAFIDQFVAPGQLNDAVYLTFGPDNQLYVPDIQHFHDVRRFSGSTGKYLGVFANSPDPTNNPIFDIQFGPDGNAYASTGKSILRLDGESGALLSTFVSNVGGFITFFPATGPATDLAVTNLQIPAGVVQGNDLSITYTVTNNSAASTVVNSWDDVVYLSTDDVFDPSDQEFGRIAHTSSLAGGAKYTETLTVTLPSVSLGDYHVFVFADRRGVVNDSVRLNNLLGASSTLEVFPPLASTHDPDHSIVVGRTLSAYTTKDIVNSALTITYTVYNETDGYTQGTLLTTTLGSGVTFVRASILPNRNGQELAWSMGTLAPYERASVAVTVALANSTTTQIDTGAKSFATLDTVTVSDNSPAAILRTDTIAPNLLASTPDANTTDPFVQEQAAKLDYDPQAIFDYLNNEVGYESYFGSLRGARGTLWSHAGNSLDVASLGVALYRASGIPARYAHGTLSESLTQQLILSMFPASFQTVGYIPAGATISDPANDPQLLAETRDHFWYQFESDTGFLDADPLFEGATVGRTFAPATDSFAEVVDNLRQKTQIQLTTETFSSASAAFAGDGLSTTIVLTNTFNNVDLVGRPITVGHFVNSSNIGSLFLSATTNTYSPYLEVGDAAFPDPSHDDIIRGLDYQETITNFPFGSLIVTGLYLKVTLSGPGIASENFTRTLVDRIGYAARQGLVAPSISVEPDGPTIISTFDFTTLNLFSSRLPFSALAAASAFGSLRAQAAQELLKLSLTSVSGEEETARLQQITQLTRDVLISATKANAFSFALQSEAVAARYAAVDLTAAYDDQPRVVITSVRGAEPNSSEKFQGAFAIDMVRDTLRVVAAPGQAKNVEAIFRQTRGIVEAVVEDALMRGSGASTGSSTISTIAIFDAAVQAGLNVIPLGKSNLLTLDGLDISAEAKARITAAVGRGATVLVPQRSVAVGGRTTIAWYETNPVTGETVSVLEDGSHGGIAEYVAQFNTVRNILTKAKSAWSAAVGFTIGFSQTAFQYAAAMLTNSNPKLHKIELKAHALSIAIFATRDLCKVLVDLFGKADLFDTKAFIDGCEVGIAAEEKLVLALDPPLPKVQFSVAEFYPSSLAQELLNVAESISSGPTAGTVSAQSLQVTGQLSAAWTTTAQTYYQASQLSAGSATVRNAQGAVVGIGSASLASSLDIDILSSGSAKHTLHGTGRVTFYQSSTTTFSTDANWENYSAEISGDVVLTVTTDHLILNGSTLPAGTYTVSAPAASLRGNGRNSAVQLSGSASITADSAMVLLGPGSQTLLSHGSSVDMSNGVALTGFIGDVQFTSAPQRNTIVINGNATQIVRVATSATTFTTNQNMPVTFDTNVNTSFTDTYKLSAQAPPGWTVAIDSAGKVTVSSAPGLQGGTYPIQLLAQSINNPSLVAQATVHVTIVPSSPGINFDVAPDPLFTVPYLGAQIPSAFQASMMNLGPSVDSYELSFTNLPPSFNVLKSNTTVTVPAGETARLGLYLEPKLGIALPAPGTAISFNVTATSRTNASINQTRTVTFIVPEIHAVTAEITPKVVTTVPGLTTNMTIDLHSVGNVSEVVELVLTTSSGVTITGLPVKTNLTSGQNLSIPLAVSVANTVPINSSLSVSISVKFGPNVDVNQTLVVFPIRVVVPGAAASATASTVAGELGDIELSNRLNDVSIALTNLVLTPTSRVYKIQALASLDSIESLLLIDPTLVSFAAPLANASEGLASAVSTPEIQSAVVTLGNVLDSFAETVTALRHHNVELSLGPNLLVAQPGLLQQIAVQLRNVGDQRTTYNLSLLDLPASVTGGISETSITLDPGQFSTGLFATFTQTSSSELQAFEFHVSATVLGFPSVVKIAAGTVQARNEFVSVVSVTATPPFTDAGGTLDVSARLLNAVNREQQARASFVVRNSSGTQVGAASSPVDVTLTVQTSLVTLPLGSINTAGLANGSYSIVMTLLDLDGKSIPGGTGSTTFLIGSPLTASIEATPSVLPPGTNTVTNSLNIEALSPLSPLVSPLTLIGQVPISAGLRGVAARGSIAYASGTNGIQIIDYTDPENPLVVGTLPGNHLGARIEGNVLLALRPVGSSFILDVYALQNTPLAPPLIGSSPVINYGLTGDLTSNITHAFVSQFGLCYTLGSNDYYRQFGDQLAIKLNLDSMENPTIAAPTLDSVLFNTHGDNTFDPSDVSGCAESGGDHLVYGVALANQNTTYLATTTATLGDTQNGVGRIQVVDVTNAAGPVILKDLDIPGTVLTLGVGVSGNVGVVVGSTQGFQDNPAGVIIGNLTVTTLDVSDPLNPKIITTRVLDRPSSTFWVNFISLGGGRFAFSSQGIDVDSIHPNVLVIDASNPRNPLIGDSDIPIDLVAPNSLGTDGKFLFTADSGGVMIYTVNPLPGLPVTARVQIPNGTGVTPLSGSFNIPPAEVISGSGFDTYVFDLTLSPSLPNETLTWQSTVVGLQSGESRSVTLGTTIDFAFQGTAGQITLPRTVVAAEQVLSLAPASQTIRPGGATDFNVTFTNPAPVDVTYQLSVGGVSSQWVGIDSTVTVPAGGTVTKVLRLTTGAFDVVGDYGFLVNAVVDSVTTSVAGTLVLTGAPILPDAKPDSQGVVVTLTPTSAIAGQGTAATYIARLTNVGSQADGFTLSAAGLPSGFQTTFALANVNVPPGASNFRDVLLTIIPPQGTAADDYAFTVTATSASDTSIADVATSTLSVLAIGVAVEVTPESGSPQSTYQMLVTNIGQVRETFDLSLAAPAALMATLGVASVTLEPGQSTSVPITVGTIDFAFPGSLSLVGVATSRTNPLVRAADGVGVNIAGLIAMTATFDNATHLLPLPGTSSFLLLVDNIGNIEDQYSATIKRTTGPVSASLVGLQGERTQSVPLFILPGLSRGAILLNAELLAAGMGTITVMVKSLTNASVSTEITAQLQAGEQAEQLADLSLAMTVDNASAKVGQNVTFTIALNNVGPAGATGVNILDKLPTGLQFVNATTTTGSYSATTGLWNVGSLAQGATTTLTIIAKLLTDQAVSNVAQVATSDQRDPDSTPGNNVVGEDDQFSAGVGACLTGGPLVAGLNRLVLSCVTPGGFAAFVVGSQPGSYHYSQWGTTVDIADPGVPAIGVGNSNGVAVVLVSLTAAQLAQPLYVQAFEMLPAHKVSNLIVAQHTPEKTGTPLVADTIGLGTTPDTLAALQSGTPALKAAALARWQAAGVSELVLEHLAAIDILFSDLPNDQLAATQGNFIVLDANAAGHGWFVDTTPGNDVEFTRDASGALLANTDAARSHIDALTVILHELGHVLGEPDEPTGSVNRLMSESLSPGLRRLPTTVTTPNLGALDVNRDGFVSPMDVLLIINELNLSTGRLARTTVAGNVLDVTGDGLLTPIDALRVINYLNRVSSVNRSLVDGEGESSMAQYGSGSYSVVESSLVDDKLLDALAADAVNAWLDAKRNYH